MKRVIEKLSSDCIQHMIVQHEEEAKSLYKLYKKQLDLIYDYRQELEKRESIAKQTSTTS